MANNPKNWKQHAATLKRKRLSDKDDKKVGGVGSHIIDEGEMIVQRLANVATGKSMKYEKLGPQEFVSFNFDEISIENLQKACTEHFREKLLEGQICDILASQNGPSCTKLSHIKNFRLIFVRFISKPQSISVLKSLERISDNRSAFKSLMPKAPSLSKNNTKSENAKTQKPTSVYPKSLSITTMLKLGSAITEKVKTQNLDLAKFNMEELKWEAPSTHQVSISETILAKGGFRDVIKAIDVNSKQQFVIKRFLNETIEALSRVNEAIEKKETVDSLSRKAIQTHMLAKNVTERFIKHCKLKEVEKDFGSFFTYNDAYLGWLKKDDATETVMVEDFIEGDFKKYINNNGVSIHSQNNADFDTLLKAQCLVHYSYEMSEKNFMLVDVQGCGLTLYNPEIATAADALKGTDGLRFCLGNLSHEAIQMFLTCHICNRYCKMVGLTPTPETISDSITSKNKDSPN